VSEAIKTDVIPDGLEGYLMVMAWWNAKDLTGKARVIGEDILDGWFEQVVRDEFLGGQADG
jgi:hypothetical protein